MYLSGEGGDNIGIALRLASDRSSVRFAIPEILKVTFSLSNVSIRVGVEIALSIAARWHVDFVPFNYHKRK